MSRVYGCKLFNGLAVAVSIVNFPKIIERGYIMRSEDEEQLEYIRQWRVEHDKKKRHRKQKVDDFLRKIPLIRKMVTR